MADEQAPSTTWGLESYMGLILVTPLARCSGCDQVVVYRDRNGITITAEKCHCTEASDG